MGFMQSEYIEKQNSIKDMDVMKSVEKVEECSFVKEDRLSFFKGCRNAFLLVLPFWIAIFIILYW